MKGFTKVTDYQCPSCGDSPSSYEGYTKDGESYPKIENRREGYNLDGEYHDWEEYHVCQNCGTKYFFTNGAY